MQINKLYIIAGLIIAFGLFYVLAAHADESQIFNSDQTHLYATLETIPTDRQEPTGHTMITLTEQGARKPDVNNPPRGASFCFTLPTDAA